MPEVEHWKAVPSEPFLEASTLGRIRRLERHLAVAERDELGRSKGNFRKLVAGGPMNPWMQTTGYLAISYRLDGKTHKRYVHRLVAEAFITGAFEGATVDHVDGNRLNNSPSNLQWVTRQENTRRQNAMGRGVPKGSSHPGAKLTDADVERVRQLRQTGISYEKIGGEFGVSGSLAHKICNGTRRSA